MFPRSLPNWTPTQVLTHERLLVTRKSPPHSGIGQGRPWQTEPPSCQRAGWRGRQLLPSPLAWGSVPAQHCTPTSSSGLRKHVLRQKTASMAASRGAELLEPQEKPNRKGQEALCLWESWGRGQLRSWLPAGPPPAGTTGQAATRSKCSQIQTRKPS